MAITENDIEESHKRLNEKIESISGKALELLESWKAVRDISNCQEVSTIASQLTQEAERQIARMEAQTKLPDDMLKREIHIFPNLSLVSAMMFQIRYLKNDGTVASYGDIFVIGQVDFYGTNYTKDSGQARPLARVALPFGREIEEVVSDGAGTWFIEKGRQKIHYAGIALAHKSSDDYWNYRPYEFHFPNKKVKKIAVGRVSHQDISYNNYNHLAVIIFEDGDAKAIGNNQSGAVVYPKESNVYGYAEPKDVDIKDTDGTKLKITDAAVLNCGYEYNAIVYVVEKTINGKKKKVLYGSGKNIEKTFGNAAEIESPREIFSSFFADHATYEVDKVWAIMNSSGTSQSDMHATLYVSIKDSDTTTILYGVGNGKYGQISRDIDKNSNYGVVSELKRCLPSGDSSQSLRDIVEIKGSGYNSIVVAKDKNHKLYLAGNTNGSQICNVNSGSNGTEGFVKLVRGSQHYEVTASDYVVYTSTNRRSSGADKPYLVWTHKESPFYIYHAGWDWSDYNNSSGKTVSSGNNYFAEISDDDFISSEKGICLSTRSYDEYDKGCITYAVSMDKRYLLVKARDGKWNKDSTIFPQYGRFVPIPPHSMA